MAPPGPSRLAAFAGIPRFRADQLGGFRYGWERYGDLYHVAVAGRDLWVCSSPDHVRQVLVEGRDVWQRIERTRWGRPYGLRMALGEGLLTTDGRDWQWRRRMINPAFHRELVAGMVGTVVESGADMLSRLDAAARRAEPVDLLAEMKRVTQEAITRTMFSADLTHEGGAIGRAVDEALEYVARRSRSLLELPIYPPTPARRRFLRAMRDIDTAVDRAVVTRRVSGHPGNDLLGRLLGATDDAGNGLSDAQIRSEMATIFGAGHETTANALTWLWHELLTEPEVLDRLHHEVDEVEPVDVAGLRFTRMVFDEALRVRPPVPVNGRVATVQTGLDGYAVAPEALAILVVHNIHRHPDHWERPAAFHPDHFAPQAKAVRHRYAWVPFGAGPHLCVGNSFATMEGVVLLAMLARTFTFEPVGEFPRQPATAVTMKPKGGLPVLVRRR